MKNNKLKITLYFLFTLLFVPTKVNAQFVGYYNLHDGGVDVPNSSLMVLSNNEFLLVHLGGYKKGKWSEIDKNNILLTETKTNIHPFTIYGKLSEKAPGISIDVDGLARSYAFINFSKDTISEKKLQPIFNDGANCLKNGYPITKKRSEYNWFTITIPADPEFGRKKTKYP